MTIEFVLQTPWFRVGNLESLQSNLNDVSKEMRNQVPVVYTTGTCGAG